ncbi:MAG: transposase [Pseudomonadota bacterium]|nr:transposase [Pseudomonadota bacterium]
MARNPAILQSTHPYNVGARCINREWFNIPMDEVWEIMSRQLFFIRHAYNVRIHSFVLMSNHFHLLISTPEANLSQAMANFMGETSRYLNLAGNRENETYAGRHFRSIIENYHSFTHAYKYNYRNPVKCGTVTHVESYKYSTLHGLLGLSHLQIPVEEDLLLFPDIQDTLNWLNTDSGNDNSLVIKYALKRKVFKMRKLLVTKKPHNLEFERY